MGGLDVKHDARDGVVRGRRADRGRTTAPLAGGEPVERQLFRFHSSHGHHGSGTTKDR